MVEARCHRRHIFMVMECYRVYKSREMKDNHIDMLMMTIQ